MRFEVRERDGLARVASLEIDGVTHTTPAIAYVDAWGHQAPAGRLRLRLSSLAKDGDLRISPSRFFLTDDVGTCDLDVGFRGSPYAEPRGRCDVLVMDNIATLMLDSRAFAGAVEAAKGEGLLKPVMCSVAGLPHRLAFLAYCGMDLFDSVPLIMAAERGLYLTPSGVIPRGGMSELPCSCPACLAGGEGKEALLSHNIAVAEAELRLVRNAISRGTLREMVEARVRTDPWLVQGLRLMDIEHRALQEMHAPVNGAPFFAGSKESLSRPDIVRWRERMRTRYRRPSSAKVLVLFPCSAKKPYSLSRSHRRFRAAVRASGAELSVHEVVVTSPLGIVPRELEMFYPAKDYDIPVTGHWDRDEQHMVAELVRWLVDSQKYDAVVSHLGDEAEFVNGVIGDCIDSSHGRPGSNESLSGLEKVLRDVCTVDDALTRRERNRQEMESISIFQFGEAGGALCEGARVEGRWPAARVVRDGVQRGMLSPERGMVSLTLDGGRVLSSKDAYFVDIDDFVPKGNLFAVGVTGSSPDVRIGDDVVVRFEDDVRAVGVARMCAAEMALAERGEAVHVRHVVK